MKRAEVVARFEELGYVMLRQTKHDTLYEHGVTGAKVGIAHTPSDPNWHHAAIREAEKKAVTDGAGHLRFAAAAAGAESIAAAARGVLKAAAAPLKVEEVTAAVTKALGGELKANTAAVRAALSAATRGKQGRTSGVVRIKRGWYVRDLDLAALSGPARESALELIARAGPRRAWREPAFRADALKYARGLEAGSGDRKPAPPEPEPAEVSGPMEAETTAREKTTAERKPRADRAETASPTPLPPMFEMVGEDPAGLAVLRGEDGRLWLARSLASVRFE